MIWDKKNSMVVIPPWLENRAAWLTPTFDPKAWERKISERGINLSAYSYDQESVKVCKCMLGGGLIKISNGDKPWVMLALMNRTEIPRCPCGVPRGMGIGVSVVIPKVRAGSRLGIEPVPLAPGPLISIERPQKQNFIGVAIASKKPIDEENMLIIQRVFADYALQATPCDTVDIENDFTGFLDRRKLQAVYFEVRNEEVSAKELYSINCLAGLLLRAKFKSLFSIHLISNIDGIPDGLRYASQWSPGAKPPENADDW